MIVIKDISSLFSYVVHWDPCVFVIFVNRTDKLTALRMNMLLEMNTQRLYLAPEKAIKMLFPNVRQIIKLLYIIIAQNIS